MCGGCRGRGEWEGCQREFPPHIVPVEESPPLHFGVEASSSTPGSSSLQPSASSGTAHQSGGGTASLTCRLVTWRGVSTVMALGSCVTAAWTIQQPLVDSSVRPGCHALPKLGE